MLWMTMFHILQKKICNITYNKNYKIKFHVRIRKLVGDAMTLHVYKHAVLSQDAKS